VELTRRTQNMVTGLIALVLIAGTIVVGVSWSFGAFDNTYPLKASFDAAGQGLQKNSDVKIRGVNVGKVDSVNLVNGRALVSMSINHGDRIPFSATAIVRAKTLFGEKYVDIDPGSGETTGPYYARDGEMLDRCDVSKQANHSCTTGGFELEQVLADAYPLLKKIQPGELMTVVSVLADAGRGLGPEINRSIVNGQKVLDVTASHDADTRQFLQDLAVISQQLDLRAADVVDLADAINRSLPSLNSRSNELNTLLVQTGRLSDDVADLLIANKDFIDKSFNGGQQVLDLLYNHRFDLVPTVVGLRQYLQTLAEAIRIPVGDGTSMAAVEGLLGGDNPACSIIVCPGATATAPVAPATTATAPTLPNLNIPGLNLPSLDLPNLLPGMTAPSTQSNGSSGMQGVLQYLLALGSG